MAKRRKRAGATALAPYATVKKKIKILTKKAKARGISNTPLYFCIENSIRHPNASALQPLFFTSKKG